MTNTRAGPYTDRPKSTVCLLHLWGENGPIFPVYNVASEIVIENRPEKCIAVDMSFGTILSEAKIRDGKKMKSHLSSFGALILPEASLMADEDGRRGDKFSECEGTFSSHLSPVGAGENSNSDLHHTRMRI